MTDPLPLAETMRRARKHLNDAGSTSAEIDAQLLVEHVTGTTRLDMIARPDHLVPAAQIEIIEAFIERRAGGEPVHRILGAREFYGLRMTLSPQTLEPRPDTETLVDAVLPFAIERAQGSACRILDLGTGTGAILIALLAQVRGATGLGVDISREALETATRNADLNGVADRFAAFESDWFAGLDDWFDLIVSNPPYIATRDVAELDREVRDFDPGQALDGGVDGLDCYRKIAAGAKAHLVDDGRIGVEIGYDQKDMVTAIFQGEGFHRIEARKDLGGNDRVLIFQPND